MGEKRVEPKRRARIWGRMFTRYTLSDKKLGKKDFKNTHKKTIMERRKQGDKCFWGDSWNWLAIWLAANDFS